MGGEDSIAARAGRFVICRRVLDPRGIHGRVRSGGAALALLLVLWTASVHAQGKDSPEYQAAIAEAIAEFQAGNWAEAQTLFREAHRLSPSARTLRGLGIVAFELRRYVDALDFLQQALDDPRKPLDAQQRAGTREQIARAERFIARFEVELSPAEAQISVDGAPRALRDGQLRLDPGERELTVSAEGYQRESRRIVVEGGARGRLSFQLHAEGEPSASSPAGPPGPVASEPAPADDGGGIPTGALIVGSVGLALLAGSAVTGSLALSAKGELEDACGTRMTSCDEKHESTADKTKTLALATDVLWISGAAAVSSAIVWALLAGDDGEAESGVSAGLGRDGLRVQLRGRF